MSGLFFNISCTMSHFFLISSGKLANLLSIKSMISWLLFNPIFTCSIFNSNSFFMTLFSLYNYFILFYIILYYFILFYIILYYFILFYIILYYFILFYL